MIATGTGLRMNGDVSAEALAVDGFVLGGHLVEIAVGLDLRLWMYIALGAKRGFFGRGWLGFRKGKGGGGVVEVWRGCGWLLVWHESDFVCYATIEPLIITTYGRILGWLVEI